LYCHNFTGAEIGSVDYRVQSEEGPGWTIEVICLQASLQI